MEAGHKTTNGSKTTRRQPLVSVVIPSWNSAGSIVGCLESVCAQSHDNIEIVIVDDGSTDASCKMVEDFFTKHKRFPFKLIRQENHGPGAARNQGIFHSRGEYVAFLDSDDTWASDKVERQLGMFAEHPGFSLIATAYTIGNRKRRTASVPKIEQVSLQKLLFKNYFMTSTIMVRRNVFEHLRFDEHQKYSEDYRLWLEICSRFCCGISNAVLTTLADKPTFGHSGLSSKLWQMEASELSNYKRLYMNNLPPPMRRIPP